MAPALATEPSNYMQTLTRYLSNIMNSTLLGLPREIKELIYFDALSHAAEMILVGLSPIFLIALHSNRHTGPPSLARRQEDQ
jgi:exocyst complex component 6